MRLIKHLSSYGESKIQVEVFPGCSSVFMISSSGISTHPNEKHIDKCLHEFGSFQGYLDVNRAAIPLAKELLET